MATTGPTPLAHPPRFSVSAAQAEPFLGRFRLVAPLDRNIISGAYIAGYNERNFVEGSLAVYHYEAAGRETVLVGRTYEYHPVGREMTIDVISPQNQVILARMNLHAVGGGKLAGTLTSLVPPGHPERITMAPASVAGSTEPGTKDEVGPAPATAGTVPAQPTPQESPLAAVIAAVRAVFRF